MKKILFFALVFILLSSFVFAVVPDGEAYYNLNNVLTDSWGSHTLTNVGASFVTDYPTYAVTGDGATHSEDFESTESDLMYATDADDFSFVSGATVDIPFSISMWIKPETLVGSYLFAKWSVDGYEYALYLHTDGKLNMYLYNLNAGAYIYSDTGAGVVSAGSWQHVVFTYDGSESGNGIKIYVDADAKAMTPGSSGAYVGMTNGGTNPTIGTRGKTAAYSGHYDGLIDEVKVWKNDELSQSEITELYNGGSPPAGSDFELTAKNVYNSTTITNFSVNMDNGTVSKDIYTQNGSVFWSVVGEFVNITVFNATNYFDTYYLNYNTSTNLNAELEPSVFKARVLGNISNASISNFTITISNGTFSQSKSTTSGFEYVNFSKNQNYTITILSPNYANLNINISNINGSFNYSFYLYENNSVWVTIYDGKTFLLLNNTSLNVRVDGQNTSYFQEYLTTNGTLRLQDLDADTYEFIFFNNEYPEQSYFIALQDNEHKDLSAYIINSTYLINSPIRIINANGINIETALITMQESISGTFTTISQKYTDSTGTALFYLKLGTTYRAVVDKTGYLSQTAFITPVTNPYPVTLLLSDGLNFSYVSPSDCLSIYTFFPTSGALSATFNNFSFFVNSPSAKLSYYGIYFNSTNFTNISTPSGGTTTNELNLNESSGSVSVSYFFKCSGASEYWQNVTYYLATAPINTSLINIIDDLGGDLDNEAGGLSSLFKYGIILFILLLVILVCFELGVPSVAYGFIATIILVIFTVPPISWVNPLFTLLISVVFISGSILTYQGEGQNYG